MATTKKKGRPENLLPVRTKAEAIERGRKGGIKSGEARREKKRMSQIYAEFLADKFEVDIDGEKRETTGADLVGAVVKKVLAAGGSPAVSLMKELREATEGSLLTIDGKISTPVEFVFVDPPKDEDAIPE